MTVTIAAPVYTRIIADEIVSLIQTNATSLSLTVVQVGDVQQLVALSNFTRYLPGVFVKPDVTTYEGLDASGTDFRATEQLRICYAYSIANVTTQVYDKASDDLSTIASALQDDANLSNIASTISPCQIELAGPAGVEWNPEEDLFMAQAGTPIKVVVLAWGVQWLARRTS